MSEQSNESTKIKLNKEQLIEHLKIQIKLLQSSSKQYDSGLEESAIQIATILRTLLENSGLLSTLKWRKHIRYFNTAIPYSDTNLLTHSGLTCMKISNSCFEYKPHYDSNFIGFFDYKDWISETVISDGKGNRFTRRKLYKLVADKDGGAHVDEDIPIEYNQLKNENSMNWEMTTPFGSISPNSVIYASLRQIAYELLKSLWQKDKKLFSEEYF